MLQVRLGQPALLREAPHVLHNLGVRDGQQDVLWRRERGQLTQTETAKQRYSAGRDVDMLSQKKRSEMKGEYIATLTQKQKNSAEEQQRPILEAGKNRVTQGMASAALKFVLEGENDRTHKSLILAKVGVGDGQHLASSRCARCGADETRQQHGVCTIRGLKENPTFKHNSSSLFQVQALFSFRVEYVLSCCVILGFDLIANCLEGH